MRFESVKAYAFGPFTSGQELEFAPGLTIIYGANEAGKSSWHAALYAGLCGARRGHPTGEERAFAARHKPWTSDRWEVGAVVVLEDGRRMELRHDLAGRVDCRATDLGLGRDCSNEIMYAGSPDGSVWLGLDRRAFLATACMRQAELLAVAESAETLRDHLQRAAATSGVDATAARAIERIVTFRSTALGSEYRNSSKPLRVAIDEAQRTRRELEETRIGHAAYVDLATRADQLDRRAEQAQHALHLFRAGRARRDLGVAVVTLERAVDLTERYPHAPAGLVEGDALSQQVAASLAAWQARPAPVLLEGESAEEVRAQIAALPAMPDGDLAVAPEVKRAHEAHGESTRLLARHTAERPEVPPASRVDASDGELRELARVLAEPEPAYDAALEERLERARQQVEAAGQPGVSAPLVLGAVIALLGLVGVLAALLTPGTAALVPGATLLIVGAALAGLSVVKSTTDAKLRALEQLRTAEQATGAQQAVYDEWQRRYEAAAVRTRELGLQPDNPHQLLAVATANAEASQSRRDLARWEQQMNDLTREADRTAETLRAALADRGGVPGADLQAAWDAYERACSERALQAQAAGRRKDLEQRLADRQNAESAAAEVLDRRRAAESALRAAAVRCALDGDDPALLVHGLEAWQERHQADQDHLETARREWAALQALLAGRSVDDLSVEAQALAEAATRLTGNLDPHEVETVVLEQDVAAQQQFLEQAAEAANRDSATARGTREERLRTLPSVAEAEEAEQRATNELARLKYLDSVLQRTQQFLEVAQERVHRGIAPVLADAVREWLPRVTGGRYTEVAVDPERLEVTVRAPDGAWRSAGLLSHGTAEQVYLLLRVTMAGHLTKKGEICPLVLDDVTVHCDEQRKQAVLDTLHTLSQERQVILFTQEDAVLAWAHAHLQEPHDRVVYLPAPAAAEPALAG